MLERRRLRQLKTLLRVRQTVENQRARALASAEANVQRKQEDRRQIERYQRSMLDEAQAATTDAVDAPKADDVFQFERHLNARGIDTDATIRELQGAAEQSRTELRQAMQRRQVAESLVTRSRRRIQEHVDDETRRLQDEMNIVRAAAARQRSEREKG